jgi:hypothetical protein
MNHGGANSVIQRFSEAILAKINRSLPRYGRAGLFISGRSRSDFDFPFVASLIWSAVEKR